MNPIPTRRAIAEVSTTIAVLIGIVLLSLILSGCSTIAPGSDPVVVHAERVTGMALDTFDVFLKLEYENRARLAKISPDIHVTAELIRAKGFGWLSNARAATKRYKADRTEVTRSILVAATRFLEDAVLAAQKYIALSKATP